MKPTLIEYFAAHETLDDIDADDVVFPVETAEKMAGPKPVSWEDVGAWEWNAKWRAKLRFIRAGAMAEEAERMRVLATSSEIKAAIMSKDIAETRPYPDYDKEWEAIPGNKAQPKTTNLSFSEALEAMKQGKKVARTLPILNSVRYMIGAINVSYSDLIATDWRIVEEA